MNTLDLYIDHLKAEQRRLEAELESVEAGEVDGFGIYHSITDVTVELNRAIEFANERGLTVRHLTHENRQKREKRALAVAEELWLAQNADDHGWAKMAWAEMTMPDDWDIDALDLLDEAYAIVDKENANG